MNVGSVRGGDVVVSVALHGPARTLAVDATVDTGFNRYLTLPKELMLEFGHGFVDRVEMTLADGNPVICNGMMVHLTFGGHAMSVPAVELGSSPLIGIAFLEGHRLTIDVVEGGTVAIEVLSSSI